MDTRPSDFTLATGLVVGSKERADVIATARLAIVRPASNAQNHCDSKEQVVTSQVSAILDLVFAELAPCRIGPHA